MPSSRFCRSFSLSKRASWILTWAISIDEAPPDAEKGCEVFALCAVCGEPKSLEELREGEARERREPPPPPPLAPPCTAAVTEGNCEFEDDGIVRPRAEYSPDCCCIPCPVDGEKGDDVDEMEELRLTFERETWVVDG